MSAVAGDVPMPGGSGGALVAAVWPDASETDLAAWEDDHASVATDFEERARELTERLSTENELLVGAAGDANERSAADLRDYLYTAADVLNGAAGEAAALRAAVLGMKTDLTLLADEATAALDAAPDAAAHGVLMARYGAEAESIAAAGLAELEAVPVTPPPPPPPWETRSGGEAPATDTDAKESAEEENPSTDPTVRAMDYSGERDAGDVSEPGSGASPDSALVADEGVPASPESDSKALVADEGTADGPALDRPLVADEGLDALNDPSGATDTSGAKPLKPMMPGSMMQSGMPAASMPGNPAQSISGAASSVKPPQIPSSAFNPSSSFNPASGASGALNAPTSPAASNPFQALSAPLDTAGSFQSGLSAGLGSSGLGPRAVDPAMVAGPATTVTGQPVAAAQAPGVVGPGPAGPPPPAGPAGPVGGPMGGMMPPMSGGAAAPPLTPYTPPGGGGVATAGPAGTAGTAPAGSGAPPPGAAGPSGQGSGSTAPLVAGSTAASAAAAGDETNPDLATATAVLEGLVRGTNANDDLVYSEWAVAVTHTGSGPVTVIASSIGGGAYLPAAVVVPVGVRVAVVDPALPMGWAAQFMGWQHPVDIVLAHAQALSERTAGVRISAVATTDAFGPRPKDGADFAAVTVREILGRPGSPPVLDGAHQHRLATVDPALAQRISALDRGGDVATALTSDLSVAVVRAAQEHTRPDGTALVHDEDVRVLLAVGNRESVDWGEHFRAVEARDGRAIVMPEAAAKPIDLDDAEVSVAIRARYAGFYIAGRIVELVRCWRHSPPSVLDIAYCGVMAGAGAAVAGVVASWEQHGAGG